MTSTIPAQPTETSSRWDRLLWGSAAAMLVLFACLAGALLLNGSTKLIMGGYNSRLQWVESDVDWVESQVQRDRLRALGPRELRWTPNSGS